MTCTAWQTRAACAAAGGGGTRLNKIRDFFYDHNDILVVLLIVLVAAGLILWRVNVIMEYPKLAAEEIARSNTSSDSSTTSDNTDSSSTSTDDGSTSTDSDSGTDYITDAGTNLNDGLIWEKGVLKNNLDITVPSGSATEAVQALVDAGLFASYDEFEQVATDAGLDTGVIAGSYEFPAGSTQEDIVKMVIGVA